jgi:hypothetical protein
MIETVGDIVTIMAFGGFGAVVNALLIMPPDNQTRQEFYKKRYILPCPLRPGHDKALGWFGPFLVGAAAGLSIFVGIEGVLGLKVEEAVTNPAGWVRLAALGTVAGYLGMVMLDSVSIAFARTLLQREKDYIRETEQLHLQAESSKAILIADKFREMKHYDEA